MNTSIEDTVNFLLSMRITTMPHCGDPPRLSIKDRTTLENIRYKSAIGLTTKQRNYVLLIISKYLLLLKTLGWPVDDLMDPNWTTPLLPDIVRTKYHIEFSNVTDEFIIYIPYDQQLVKYLNSIANSKNFFDLLIFDKPAKVWRVMNGEQGKKLIKWLLRYYRSFSCDEEVTEQINNIEVLTPTVKFLNNQWILDNAAPSLQTVFDEIVTKELTPVQQAYEISSCYVSFHFSAKNYLKNWLTTNQVNILCEEDVIIKCSEVQELIDLTLLINKWPILVIYNKFDNELTTALDTVNWPKYELGTVMKKKDCEEPCLLLDKCNKPIKGSVKVPWVVRYKSSVILQSIFSRYNKLVVVEKD